MVSNKTFYLGNHEGYRSRVGQASRTRTLEPEVRDGSFHLKSGEAVHTPVA